MSPLDTIIVVLLSVGALQGIVYGGMLLRKKQNSLTASRLLAVVLFCFSYRLIIEVLLLFGIGRYDVWYHLTQEVNWVYGPLIYLFVKAWLDPSFKLSRKDWVHFVPVLVEFVSNNFVRWQNFYWDGTRESLSWMGYWGYVVWMNYPFKYLVASVLLVAYARKGEQLVLGHPAGEKTAWLARILRVFWWYFGLVTVVMGLDFVLFFDASFKTFYWYFTRFYYYPLFVGIAALTYWLGIEGFNRRTPPAAINRSAEQRLKLEALATRLNLHMKEARAFVNPDLSLDTLAAQLEVKPYLVSQCIKEVMQTKLTDYVNKLRMEEMKRLLLEPKKDHYTLLSLAFEAGFASKASFHRAVKKYEGVSPSELRDKLR